MELPLDRRAAHKCLFKVTGGIMFETICFKVTWVWKPVCANEISMSQCGAVWNDKHGSILTDESFQILNAGIPMTTRLLFLLLLVHICQPPSSPFIMSVTTITRFVAPLTADEVTCCAASCSSYHCRGGWTWWSSPSTPIYWNIQSGRAKKEKTNKQINWPSMNDCDALGKSLIKRLLHLK